MAPPTLNDRLLDIVEALDRLERITAGKTFDDYVADELVHDAVERNLERISEASRHIPDGVKERSPEVPWRRVRALGNVLRHGYDVIDDGRIWGIVRNDLPALRRAIQAMLRSGGS